MLGMEVRIPFRPNEKSASDLKAVTGPLNDKAGLETALNNLGMGDEMVPKFSKVISDFVSNSGGDAARKFFASLMKEHSRCSGRD